MSLSDWIYAAEASANDAHAGGAPIQQVGGKAANLIRLQQAGQEVPTFFTVTAAAFAYAMAESGIAQKIETIGELDDEAAILQAAAELRAMIAGCQLPADMEEAIRRHYEQLCGPGDYVAVRSSAVDEDSAERSFAGMHDSFLFIRGQRDVLRAVRRVWASAFNERAISYRLRAMCRCAESRWRSSCRR